MSKKVIIITAGTAVTLPAVWNPSNNTIEVIGGGGSYNASNTGVGSSGQPGLLVLTYTPGSSNYSNFFAMF